VSVLYLGSLYAGVFAEAGKAWTSDELDLNGNQKDVGFDLRLKGFTFYSYPVAASFEAAYSLNDVAYAHGGRIIVTLARRRARLA
jgi:outer membrane translocation and assembly module TamA